MMPRVRRSKARWPREMRPSRKVPTITLPEVGRTSCVIRRKSVVFPAPLGPKKTTLLRLITHEVRPTSGNVIVGTFRDGRISRGQRALLRRTLGIIYEDFRLLNGRSVFENVALAVRIMGRFSNEEVIPRVLYALEEVGLHDKQSALPEELSASERQRVAIARAIVNRPAVILADEPTGALEKRGSAEILVLLQRILAEGAALVLTTTRPSVAESFPARVLTIEDGHIRSGPTGTPSERPWAGRVELGG